MQIYGVSFDMVGKQPIVLLKTTEGNRFLRRVLEESLPVLIKLLATPIVGPAASRAAEYWQIVLGPLFLLVVLFARGGINGLLESLRRD